MSSPVKQYPFYIKSTVIIFGLVLICYALYSLKGILAPIAISLVMAILLNPLVNKLQSKGVHKIVAIALSLLAAFIIVGGILFFISTQLMSFADNLPELKLKFNEHLSELQRWVAANFNFSVKKQQAAFKEMLNTSESFVGGALGGAFGTLGFIFLIPIYVFLWLFYKTLIVNFFHEVFAMENTVKVSEVLVETKSAIQSYMVGLLLEALVVAVMNVAALLILGVEYAILLGVLGALLNMLPYIGGFIAIALAVIVVSITQDGYTTQLWVLVAYLVIQFIDNNLLVPFLVSSRVKINAFFSIVIVLMGGALWGIAGMFLSIPFLAILKIIFDRLPEMKPWGKLLGDTVPTKHKGEIWMRRIQTREALAEKNAKAEDKVNI